MLAGAGIGLALQNNQKAKRKHKCDEDRDNGVAVCTRYEDEGYLACGQYRDDGYHACGEYRDDGYSACERYEDRGYEACNDWDSQCCDWWPCSWACEVISWFCVAWVWISNWVCVAWYWVSHLVCVAWYWVSHIVCVAWYWVSSLVCKAWHWIVWPFCHFWCWLQALFTGNEVSDGKSECKYGWTARFRIEEGKDCVLNVTLRIRLNPDSDVTAAQLAAQRAVWEPAIEQAWTGRFPIVKKNGDCACESYRVVVDVQFVTSGEHHTVRVRSGTGRADMTNWFITSTGGTAAHEAGHMFGNPDEYPDKECPNRNVTNDGSIMRSSQTGTVRPRHYNPFADWISAETCCDYEVAER